MARIDIAERKWYRKTIAAFRSVWPKMIKSAESLEAFIKGMADFLGVPESTVRASLPVKNWEEFQRNPEIYVETAIRKIERAYQNHKWKRKLIEAFSTPA